MKTSLLLCTGLITFAAGCRESQQSWHARSDSLQVTVAPTGVSTVDTGAAPFSVRTHRIGRAKALTTAEPSKLRVEDGVAQLTWPNAVESWLRSSQSFEQRWRFETAPEGEGDLVVEVDLTGATARERTEHGIVLQAGQSGTRVVYSHATFIDAAGVKTPIEVTVAERDSRLVMTVPQSVLASSTWPAVLDPTLSVESQIAPTANQIGDPVRGQNNPVAKAIGNKVLVAWEDDRFQVGKPVVYATWFDKQNPNLVSRFLLAPGQAKTPVIAAAGARFLVAWVQYGFSDNNILGAWVDAATGAVESRFVISALLSPEDAPGVACDNGSTVTCVVIYRTDNNGAGGVNATRLTEGATSGTTSEIVAAGNNLQFPVIAFNGARFLVVWHSIISGKVDLSAISFLPAALPASSAGTLVYSTANPSGGRQGARLIPGPSGEALLVHFQIGPNYWATRLGGAAGLTPLDPPFQPWLGSDGVAEQGTGFYDSAAYNLYAYSGTSQGVLRRRMPNGATGATSAQVTLTFAPYAGSVALLGPNPGSSSVIFVTAGPDGDRVLVRQTDSSVNLPILAQSSQTFEEPTVGTNPATGEALVAYRAFSVVNSDGGSSLGFTVMSSDGGIGGSSTVSEPRMLSAPVVGTRAGQSLVTWLVPGSGRCGALLRGSIVTHATAVASTPVSYANDVCERPAVLTFASNSLLIYTATGVTRVANLGLAGQFDGGSAPFSSAAQAATGVVGPSNNGLLAVSHMGSPATLDVTLVNSTGVTLATNAIGAASLPTGGKDELAVDTDGTQYVVAWVDTANLATTRNDVYGVRVNAAGVPIDASPVALDVTTAATTRVALSWNGFQHVLAMENEVADAGRVIDLKWFNSSLQPMYSKRLNGTDVVKEPALGSFGQGQTLLAFTRSVEAPGVAANRVFTTRLQVGNGDTCTTASDCVSGFCVQGVCCNSGCSGTCQTCLAAQGAPADGTCSPKPTTVECRASTGVCDPAEKCDGTNPGCPGDALAPSTQDCRAAVDGCDVAEKCTGSSNTCPADLIQSANAVCNSSAAPCALPGKCDGLSTVCPAVGVRPANAVCRPAAGPCDIAEFCDGTTQACPAETFVANTAVCREVAGDCDVAERCTGASADCPVDLFKTNEVCRVEAGACDLAERCSGTSAVCPANSVRPNDFVCRTKGGVCDLEEKCNGVASECPVDTVDSQSVCRTAAGSCDTAERCNGASKECPTDLLALDGQSCGEGGQCGAGVCRVGSTNGKSRYGFGCGGCAVGGVDVSVLAFALVMLARRRGRKLPLRSGGAVLALVLLGAGASQAAGKENEKLHAAFVGINQGAGVSAETTKSVTEFVQTQLNNAGIYEVTGPGDISNLLGLERQKQLLGCGESSSSCATELAGALNADRIISGDLSRIDDTFLLNLSLQDARTGKALGRSGRRVDGKLATLLDEVPAAVTEVLEQETDKRFSVVEPVHFGGLSVGLRADGDVFALGIAPGISAEYAWRYAGVAVTLIPKATPGGRLEGRVYPFVVGRVRPFVGIGTTVFSTGLGLRGALGVAVAVSHLHIGFDAGYEYYAVDFGPPSGLSRHAILLGLSLSWAFSS